MLLNETTTLYTSRLVLRPYRRWHVPQYHAWMEDETVREQTASERLTMQEEEEMQQSWRLDEDKLTFIVHLRSPFAPSPVDDPKGFLQAHNDSSTMLGDVNLFLHSTSDSESEPSSPTTSTNPKQQPKVKAELEIMFPLSCPLYKPRTGLALETLQLFISYASKHLDLRREQFIVKVGYENVPSLKLFEKLGFRETKRVEVFREVEMGWGGFREGEEEGNKWSWEKQEEEGWEIGILEDPRDPERD